MTRASTPAGNAASSVLAQSLGFSQKVEARMSLQPGSQSLTRYGGLRALLQRAVTRRRLIQKPSATRRAA